jgi:F-type H+-transporting ATPase subunit gamma
MERLSEIEARIGSFTQLEDVIGVMRSLAASRVQQAQDALPAIRSYSETIGAAIARAESVLPAPSPRPLQDRSAVRGVVLFCGEHGFCGPFNEKLIESVADSPGGTELYIVGTRGALLAQERKIAVAWSAPMATSIGMLTSVAHVVAEALYERFSRGGMANLAMVFARYTSHGHSSIEREVLLPLDRGRFRRFLTRPAPLSNLAPEVLIDRLIGEYFFAQLVRGAAECFASENAARVALTQSARHAIEEKLEDLTGQRRQLRQQEITNEILEVISGSEALAKRD